MVKREHYKDFYILQGNWGSHGWEDIGEAEVSDKDRVKKLQALLEEYNERNSRAQFRIVSRRVPNS